MSELLSDRLSDGLNGRSQGSRRGIDQRAVREGSGLEVNEVLSRFVVPSRPDCLAQRDRKCNPMQYLILEMILYE